MMFLIRKNILDILIFENIYYSEKFSKNVHMHISNILFYRYLHKFHLVLNFYFFHNPTLLQFLVLEIINHFFLLLLVVLHNMDILYHILYYIFLLATHVLFYISTKPRLLLQAYNCLAIYHCFFHNSILLLNLVFDFVDLFYRLLAIYPCNMDSQFPFFVL